MKVSEAFVGQEVVYTDGDMVEHDVVILEIDPERYDGRRAGAYVERQDGSADWVYLRECSEMR